ncbi:Apoptotic ATPase [Handroanthus impetiginosus]|uniref:Apoptotic ATPase n=1 Tax=Handroanthus impetiginosus TaxID=429701 RepID=A0A2G9H6M4_9LAMI|nr:Apoptotic ATPase [Handroanthus impetiginosus]
MLNQITDSFFSKLMEKLVDYAFNTFADKKNLESTLETLKNNLDSLSQKAFDVKEKINNAELSGKKKRKREVEEWLKQVKIIENEVCRLEGEVQTQGFFGKFFIGDQATQLNAKVHLLVEQSQHFGELLVDVYETRGEELLTTNLCGKGFKANLKRIWNLLKSNEVSSIGIYGMGGVGKTTLVKHINNIILEKRKEKHVCWITVSQMFSIKKLQDEIAHFIGLSDLFNEENEEKRAARLKRAISGKNIILILDDVWENLCLEKLGDPLRIKDCRLILTTRSLEVCCQMGCQEKVEVQKLHIDEAWDLFKQKLGLDIALAPEVEKIAESMAKVCDGLPLGIIVLVGSMRDETSIEVWRNELDKLRDPSMLQDDEEDQVFKVLKYSFDKLDSNHKHCFLRCSLYPENFIITKGLLVDRYISEELVDKGKSRHSQIDQGHSILNKLIKICLLEEASKYCVKMHDLVRVMALKITKRKYMVISESRSLKEILTEGEWIKDLEKVSLMCKDVIEIPDGMSLDCPDLTTLICGQYNLKFISDSFFSRLDSLCFLNLSETNFEKLPNSLSNLEKLKSLDLSYCQNLVDIPNLGKLKKLKEFDLFATAITKLPQGLFLSFPLLQVLRLPYTMKAPVEEIVSLKCLEEFDGRVENVSDLNKFFTYRKSQFMDMFHILVFGRDYEKLRDYEMSWRTKRHYLYRENQVKVRGCDLKNEDLSVLVQDIPSLTLTVCKGLSNSLLDAFPRLSKPGSLKALTICDCQEMECFLDNKAFLTANLEYESRFPLLGNLERIALFRLPNFIAFFQNIGAAIEPPPPQAIVSSSVRVLIIWECYKMKKLGLQSSAFPNLEKILIVRCNELEEIIEVQEAEGRVVSLPKLKNLFLYELPRLKSICNTTMSCDSIERIELMVCPELKKLPLYFDPTSPSPPQTLKEILAGDKEWWESLEWEHPTHSHLLQPLVKFVSWGRRISESDYLL